MALFDSNERKVLLGAGIGIVGLSVVRQVLPAFAGLGRPLAKATIKSGLKLYDRSRESMARMVEVFEDLSAEAREEMRQPIRPEASEGNAIAPESAARTNGGA